VTRDDRLRIAVFIDFDNIEIGVKSTLGASFDAGLVLEALKERGDVVSKTAYSDWQRAGGYSRSLTQHAIKMVQRNLTPGGDKNGADINLALDALEMAFTHPHINAFVIVGGDSDFISLIEKLKQYDKKIFVVGGRQFTSIIMQRNCHEFIAYENLIGAAAAASGGRRPAGRDVRVERAPIEQAIPLVTRALEVLSEREVSPQLGLLKSTLLQLDSTFSERNYAAGSFRDFVQKLEKVGVVKLHHGKGGLLVLPADGAPAAADAQPLSEEPEVVRAERQPNPPTVVEIGAVPEAAPSENGQGGHGHAERASHRGRSQNPPPAPAVTGTNAEGIREFRRILAAGQVRRWPMYLRNVKQLIRQANAGFDERTYGFANLVDLLRAAARDGAVRVDRDRQGIIRIFQGNVVQSSAETKAAEPFADEHDAGPVADEDVIDVGGQTARADAPGAVTVDESVVVIDDSAGTVLEFPVPMSASPEEPEALPSTLPAPGTKSRRPRRRSTTSSRAKQPRQTKAEEPETKSRSKRARKQL
jgi:uncharacterized LabA/DUF88 family protein